MKKTISVCDECGFETSNSLRHPGWIGFKITEHYISRENKTMPGTEAWSGRETGEKDFCCFACFSKWAAKMYQGH